jgi:hypothetical protein
MRYEFIHDSIAKQAFYKAGAEACTRRKVEKYIRERYEACRERAANGSRHLLATLGRHDETIKSAYFTEDRQLVITLDYGGTLRLYPLPGRIYAWLKAEARLPQLTAAERERYGLADFDLYNGD